WAAGHSNDVPEAEGLATVEVLLAAGAPVGPADNRGRTALMIAAGRGHAAIVERLVAAGADPEARDNQGKTAADLAATDEVRAVLAK
ncbi:MAG: ankyrin repeat domain-containing protein, partial [Alphaproteobacteria bacterium]